MSLELKECREVDNTVKFLLLLSSLKSSLKTWNWGWDRRTAASSRPPQLQNNRVNPDCITVTWDVGEHMMLVKFPTIMKPILNCYGCLTQRAKLVKGPQVLYSEILCCICINTCCSSQWNRDIRQTGSREVSSDKWFLDWGPLMDLLKVT